MEEPNIQKVSVRGKGEVRGYISGLRNAFTGQRGGQMAVAEDSSTMHAFIEGTGACVKDPSRTLTLKPSIQA